MLISNELLEKLVAFKEYGTLAKAAEKLLVTQPTLTRSMQQLEDELGVKLFNHTVNRISLTATGELAAKRAKQLLENNELFVQSIQNFSAQTSSLNVSSTIPAPLIWLKLIAERDFKNSPLLLTDKEIKNNLMAFQSDIVISTKEIFSDNISSIFLGKEHLKVLIDENSPLAQKKSVTFKDLKDCSFLVYDQIGIWKNIIEKNIPSANFMYQSSLENLDTISSSTNFIVFRSNLTIEKNYHNSNDAKRVLVPIEDEAASIECYGNYLNYNEDRVMPFIKDFIAKWPKE